MNAALLIDAIVRQTTILIAQLSTAAGIRAPLAHIADQVFLELSREIEAQGVSKKVAADMFGLALRGYQKKVRRISESSTVPDQTLWAAVFEFLEKEGSASRGTILSKFSADEPGDVAAVLSDLVSSGSVFKTGGGDAVLYGVTPTREYQMVLNRHDEESASGLVWNIAYRTPGITLSELRERLGLGEELLESVVKQLMEDGRIEERSEGGIRSFHAETFLIPVGSEFGWESAVFDHFQAMARAIATKLQEGSVMAEEGDTAGGATLSFDIDRAHPKADEVRGLLHALRTKVNELFREVETINESRPLDEGTREKIWFYLGQYVSQGDEV